MQTLNGKQVRHLRALGHHLNPVIMVGRDEVSETLLKALEEALETHELIKVKLQEGCILDRKEVAQILAEKAGAAVVQVLGKTILLFRQAEQKKIDLP